MHVIGSPEWFNEEAKATKYIQLQKEKIETYRANFLERFAPDKLAEMSADELLQNVFGSKGPSMMQLLMFDEDYRRFGSIGKYIYTGVVYQTNEGKWHYREGEKSQDISEGEAKQKAEYIRDLLLEAVQIISSTNLNTIHDYESLNDSLSHIFFYQYAWTMKYYQMLFPYYFPGMYADGKNKTLDRAIEILGLEQPRGNKKRLIKAGEVSLFIRRCDVNNIIFNEIYASQWGWDKPYRVCPNATDNHAHRNIEVGKPNTSHYNIPSGEAERKMKFAEQAKKIEDSVDELHLKGEDREAIVRVRINQSEFRNQLLKRYGKCCLCGVSDTRFLVASHIKPWVDSEPEEKLDPDNGFLLCPNHDKLFDQGFISFEDDGSIKISSELTNVDKMFMNVNEQMKIELRGQNRKFLDYHRKHIFKCGRNL